MFTLSSIAAQCNAHGRIDTIRLIDPATVVSLPTRQTDGSYAGAVILAPGASAKTLSATALTTEFEADQVSGGDAGDYFSHTLTCRVSLGRKALDDVLWRIGESYLHIIFTDSYGAHRLLPYAQVRQAYEIPSDLGNRNEYRLQFVSVGLWPAGLMTGEDIIDNASGAAWITEGGQPWTDDSGNAWWTD